MPPIKAPSMNSRQPSEGRRRRYPPPSTTSVCRVVAIPGRIDEIVGSALADRVFKHQRAIDRSIQVIEHAARLLMRDLAADWTAPKHRAAAPA